MTNLMQLNKIIKHHEILLLKKHVSIIDKNRIKYA